MEENFNDNKSINNTPTKNKKGKSLLNNLDQSLKKLEENRKNYIDNIELKEKSISKSIKNDLQCLNKKFKDKMKWIKMFKLTKKKNINKNFESNNYKTNYKQNINSELNSFLNSRSKIYINNNLISNKSLKRKFEPKFNCLKKICSKKGKSLLKKYSSALNNISNKIKKLKKPKLVDEVVKESKLKEKTKVQKAGNFVKHLKKIYKNSQIKQQSNKNMTNNNVSNSSKYISNNIQITKSMIKNLNVFTSKNSDNYNILNIKREIKNRKLNKSQRKNLYNKISKNLFIYNK